VVLAWAGGFYWVSFDGTELRQGVALVEGKRCSAGTCIAMRGRESLAVFGGGRWDYDGYEGRS
jgi:hypothetical protein